MASFTNVFIIYNPVSTGPSKQNAEEFSELLKQKLPDSIKVELTATQHAGHGKTLAYDYAKSVPHCLIVSSSGDGGYHDVINGVLQSGSKTAVTGLLPSGNANDHYHALHAGDTVQRIASHDVDSIDLLLVEGTSKKNKFHEYAHSYAGIGLTPQVGKELTRAKLNRFTETWVTLINIPRSRSVKIGLNGKTVRYKSLVFSNIHRMSKVLTLSDSASITDDKFEVNGVQSTSLISLLLHLIKASTVGLKENKQVSQFEFQCRHDTLIQLDGEVFTLDAESTCTVTSKPKQLTCII